MSKSRDEMLRELKATLDTEIVAAIGELDRIDALAQRNRSAIHIIAMGGIDRLRGTLGAAKVDTLVTALAAHWMAHDEHERLRSTRRELDGGLGREV